MTRVQTDPAADTGSPRGAPPAGGGADEKKLGLLATALGFLMGGTAIGIIMAMAVGLERGFSKAGWRQPGWLGGDRPGRPSREELEERRAAAVADARYWAGQARQRARERRVARAEHRRRMREHVNNGRQGDKPVRPSRRGLGEFLGDGLRTSKAWYTLLDDKLARGNEKVNNAYGAIGRFGRSLWGFGTGLVEGVPEGWQHWKDQKAAGDPSICQDCAGPNDSTGKICFGCLDARYATDEQADEPPPCARCGGPNNSFDDTCFDCRRARPDDETGEAAPPDPQHVEPDQMNEEENPLLEEENPFLVPPITDEEISDWKHGMLGECDCPGNCRFQQPAPAGAESDPGPIKAQAWLGTPGELTSGPAGPAGEGDTMETGSGALAVPTTDGALASVGPQGQTNLDQLLERFRPLGPMLTKVEGSIDELSIEKQEILTRVGLIASLASRKGAPMIVQEVMEEARRVASALGAGIAEISLENTQAQELVIKALIGLEPARGGQDTLHGVGARGDINDRVDS